MITLVVVAWVVVVHFLVGIGPDSKANLIPSFLFNFAEIVAIYLGSRPGQKETAVELNFKDGIWDRGFDLRRIRGLFLFAVRYSVSVRWLNFNGQ